MGWPVPSRVIRCVYLPPGGEIFAGADGGIAGVLGCDLGYHNSGYKFGYRKLSTTSTKFSTALFKSLPTGLRRFGSFRQTGNRTTLARENADLLDIISELQAERTGSGTAFCEIFEKNRGKSVDKCVEICYDNTCVWTVSDMERCPSGLRSRS